MQVSEIELIKQRYEKRKSMLSASNSSASFYFDYFMQSERELIYLKILNTIFAEKKELKLMEIGAGMGTNIYFFLKHGLKTHNIYANELLDDRLKILRENFPLINTISGDASKLKFHNEFDIVLQSTVFTSILSNELKIAIAQQMWKMKKDNGIILWYDFIYNNPRNKDVKGIPRREIKKLFPNAQSIKFHRVTLAPFIGRYTGKYYHPINMLFPFLKTHVIALIQ